MEDAVRFVTRAQLSELLKSRFGKAPSRSTLANIACRGEGPRVHKLRLSRDAYYDVAEAVAYFGAERKPAK